MKKENKRMQAVSSWWKKNKRTMIALLGCVILFFALFTFANTGQEEQADTGETSYTEYETATVLSVEEEEASVSELFENKYVGSQTLLIKVTSGQYKNLTMSALNYLGALYGTHLKEGDPVVVSIYTSDSQINTVTVYDYNRTVRMLAILFLFFAITILIGGRKGLQSLLGLVITIICMICILIPLLMKGFPTLPTIFFICVYVAFVSYVLIGGISKKTICAMLGTFLGMGLAVMFGVFAQTLVKVDGMRMGDYLDALLQLKQGGTPIRLSGLLIGGMIISTLGAVMDVAMSISSAMQELITVNTELTEKEMWRSGMNIGRDMIGTMTNTLILAFVGSSFLLVLYIYSLNVPMYELLSSTLVSTQVVHGIASSVGVILSVPITVFICIFVNKRCPQERVERRQAVTKR